MLHELGDVIANQQAILGHRLHTAFQSSHVLQR